VKKLLLTAAISSTVAAFPALAHHAAEGIVDDEVYEMIDSLVMDTPHADLVFEDMGTGTTEITLTTRTVSSLENMIDDGLLDLASMLDGDVEVTIGFEEDGDVALTISQRP
jgi:hypothetical protein